MPREVLVTKAIRMRPSMIRELERQARKCDVNFSEYVRHVLTKQMPRPLVRAASKPKKRGRRHARSN